MMVEQGIPHDKLKAVEIEFMRKKKDTLTAYFLLVFFWYFGLHKFYIGRVYEGIFYLVSPISGFIMIFFGFFGLNNTLFYTGVILLIMVASLLLYDVFTLWRQVDRANEKIYTEIFEKITGIPRSSITLS